MPKTQRSSPRRRKCSPRRRGPPRQRYVHLGEPRDRIVGVSGPPRRGFARLGEPLRLREGRLRLGELVTI